MDKLGNHINMSMYHILFQKDFACSQTFSYFLPWNKSS